MAYMRPEPSWIQKNARGILAITAGLGAALTGYLTVSKWLEQPAAFCGAGQGCDLVLSSRWATFLGLPTALLGFLGFAAVLLLAVMPESLNPSLVKRWRWPGLFGVVTAMAAFELYMLYLMVGVLRTFCLYCSIAIGLVAILTFITWIGRRWVDLGQLIFNGLLITLATFVVTIGVYANQTPPPSPLARDLAAHLTEINGTMYGAHWCPHCADQKAMFGSAFADVPYVECSPDGGPGTPQAPACRAANISSYPTWIINGERHLGSIELEELAQISGLVTPEVDPAVSSEAGPAL